MAFMTRSATLRWPRGYICGCLTCDRTTAWLIHELADWSRIRKRVDIEHPKPGRNSFQALVGRQVIDREHVTRIAVYFVAYTKDHGIIEVISIRFADTHERSIFFR